MPQATTKEAPRLKTLSEITELLDQAGLGGARVVRDIILAYESEHLKDFPFMPDLSSTTSPARDTEATGNGGGPANHFQTCPGGAVRSATSAGQKDGRFEPRYDMLLKNHHAMRRWAESYGEGNAKGYPIDNWMLGIPESNILNHLQGHLLMHLAGDKSEDHLGHMMFNIATLIWMQEERPDLMDRTNKKVDKS